MAKGKFAGRATRTKGNKVTAKYRVLPVGQRHERRKAAALARKGK